MEKRGANAILSFKAKGEEVINSALAMQFTAVKGDEIVHPSDQQIKKSQNTERALEFFNLANNAKDPKVQIKLYQSALELDPYNVNILNNIGVAFSNADNYEKAIHFLNKAIELDPTYILPYSNRAYAYNQLDNLSEALIDVEKAIDLNPSFERAHATKGNILTKQGKFEEAEKALTKAIELNPDSSIAYFNRGYFNEEIKKYGNSLSDYLKAEELQFSNKALLYNNIAVAYRRLKQFDIALEFIEKARKSNPDLANIDGTTALIFADLGDDKQFYHYLKIALEKGCPVWNYLNDPGFDQYRNEPKLINLMDAYRNPHS
ncbi:tetratricopeptide repeat protein [Aquirufa nivalisilvae]